MGDESGLEGINTLTLEGRSESLFKPVKASRKQARLITLEEHAVTPFPTPTTSTTFATFKSSFLSGLKDRLANIELRIKIMDANNIGAQIISLNQPTAQAFTEVQPAIEFCHQANKFVYENYCQKYPQRFFAFATLPTQNGQAAAEELRRCVEEYGFVGAMINGFTNTSDPTQGLYLDDPQFDALWEVSESLNKPIFIHPRVPLQSNIKVLGDIPILHGAPYGFARETVEHVLRLMYSGVFDRFPKLKVCLGHMGEGLSWILPRTDTTFRMYNTGKIESFLILITTADNWRYRGSRSEEKDVPRILSAEYHSQHEWNAEDLCIAELDGRKQSFKHHVFGGLSLRIDC